MDHISIIKLLDKYFEGETSLEEEKWIRNYFSLHKDQLHPDLKPYEPLFQFFEEEKTVHLEKNLLELLPTPPDIKVISYNKMYLVWLRSAAAVLLLVVAAFWWVASEKRESKVSHAFDWEAHQPATFKEAWEISTSAYLKVGREMNAAANTAAKEVNKIPAIGKLLKD